jgi:hypothetical protein
MNKKSETVALMYTRAALLLAVFFMLGMNTGCNKKEEPAYVIADTAAPPPPPVMLCCADSTNDYPDGVANAFSFVLNNQCTAQLDVAMTNLSGQPESFAFTFTKNGDPYSPVAAAAPITVSVPAGGSSSATYQFEGPGAFLVATSVSMGATTLAPVVPPSPSTIVGPLTDTSSVSIEIKKNWTKPAGGTVLASATFTMCRNASGTSMSGPTILSLSKSMMSRSMTIEDSLGAATPKMIKKKR